MHMTRFRAGSRLAGRYWLEAEIGVGWMAVVYRARDERLARVVALKVLTSALTSDPAFRRRFSNEWLAARVSDPNIIPVFDAGEADGALFIAMQLVPGGDLRKVLEVEGPLSPERTVEFISPVASALDTAHAAGLVHRDVKPANILVDAGEGRPDHVYLSDFGIAKAATSAATLTGPGVSPGTPEYEAPEQLDGLAVDGRADQYALACVAYRLLAGAAPFERDSVWAVMAAHRNDPPPSLVARRPDLPGGVDQVLAKGMAKTPEQRYESCGHFADALRQALDVAPYRPGRSAAAPAPPQHTATQTGSAGAPPAARAVPSWPAAKPLDMQTPTGAQAPFSAAPPGSAGPRLTEADELYRALQAPSRQAAARPKMTARRYRPAWSVVSVSAAFFAVAAAVIVVALMRHQGKPGNAGNTGNTASSIAFIGYRGQLGTVTVNSIASADGTWLAVGSADGHPAIWRRGASGAWALVSADSPSVNALSGALNSIAHTPNGGWIAVGNVVSGAGTRPVAVTSADGVNWHKLPSVAHLPGADPSVTGVAADRNGYWVVGTQVSNSNKTAAMWWSADLQSWLPPNEHYYGGYFNGMHGPSTVKAVAVTPAGFVAAGTHGDGGVIWTVDHGQEWTVYSVARPPQASSVVVTLVTVNGNDVVAAGYAVTPGGDEPIVAIPADHNQWKAIVLRQAPGSHGMVTALTAAGSDFIAAGRIGPPGAQRAVTWRLPDGSSDWPKITPSSRDVPEITALFVVGGMVTGAGQQGETAPIVPSSG